MEFVFDTHGKGYLYTSAKTKFILFLSILNVDLHKVGSVGHVHFESYPFIIFIVCINKLGVAESPESATKLVIILWLHDDAMMDEND